MALPYKRSFNAGRQSELLFNEELHKNFEQTRHLLDIPEGKNSVPEAVLDGSLWLDRKKNELNTYVKSSNSWKNIFGNKFQIIDQMTSIMPPSNPVVSQLWIYNDVLMYYTGSEWKPIKALQQDGSQFNISVFSNFCLTSPLWKMGNTIIKDEDIEAYKKAIKAYSQGKLDALNNADIVATEKDWDYDHRCGTSEISLEDVHVGGSHQFLVPNIDIDRVFLDHKIDFNYEAPTKVCIEYQKEYIGEKTPSLIHVNPARLTKVIKRLVKIDRERPMIEIPAQNTEFYGFKRNDINGYFLVPKAEQDDDKDYECLSDGIYLSYNASQTYDYVLAVTYEFSWMKSTGTLSSVCNKDNTSSYYVQDFVGPMNVFVDGYELEEPYFTEDGFTQVVDIAEDTSKSEVSMMSSVRREFGFVRFIDLQDRAVGKVVHDYHTPLVFMNGEAIHPALGDIEFEGNRFYVRNGKRDMVWCVIELYDAEKEFDMFVEASLVDTEDETGKAVIKYDPSEWEDGDTPVLFIDGLIVKKENVKMDKENGYIYLETDNFQIGQDYILLKDRYGRLYDDTMFSPALPVGHLSESLVYLNNHLILNDTAVRTTSTVEQLSTLEYMTQNANGEVKMFVDDTTAQSKYMIWDSEKEKWRDLDEYDIESVNSFAFSYENSTRSVKFNIVTNKDDLVNIYAFNFANAIEHPLIIKNIPSSFEECDAIFRAYKEAVESGDEEAIKKAEKDLKALTEPKMDFAIQDTYVPNIGSLSVWVNGVRQYEVKEWDDGTGFSLPKPVCGIVTYVIEHPENGAVKVCEREILDENNTIKNAINAYRTTKPLYPGRVILYIDGIRQSQDSYTVLDNYTILLHDAKTKLIGGKHNFPEDKVLNNKGEYKDIHHINADRILVEVKQDLDRQENHIYLSPDTTYEINVHKYELPMDMLEASDEIMIFIDGMYYGLRNLIGYQKDIYRNSIKLMDSAVASRIFADPLKVALSKNPKLNAKYEEEYGKPYEPKVIEMTFDWR